MVKTGQLRASLLHDAVQHFCLRLELNSNATVLSCSHSSMLIQCKSLNWTAAATDPPKLQSLLMYPQKYAQCTLFAHPEGSYALSHELGVRHGSQRASFTVYGNLQHNDPPDYHHAAEQLLAISSPDNINGSAIPDAAVGPFTEVLQHEGWHRVYCQPCYQFTLPPARDHIKPAGGAEPKQLPSGYVLGELCHDDAALVDSCWPFRSDRSLAMIEELIASSHTTCVRHEDDGPVAWMLEVEPLCAGMLHVMDDHRRQGLARAVCLDLFSKLQRKWQQHQTTVDVTAVVGSDSGQAAVYVYVVDSNKASLRLMKALGLQETGVFTWVGFQRTTAAD